MISNDSESRNVRSNSNKESNNGHSTDKQESKNGRSNSKRTSNNVRAGRGDSSQLSTVSGITSGTPGRSSGLKFKGANRWKQYGLYIAYALITVLSIIIIILIGQRLSQRSKNKVAPNNTANLARPVAQPVNKNERKEEKKSKKLVTATETDSTSGDGDQLPGSGQLAQAGKQKSLFSLDRAVLPGIVAGCVAILGLSAYARAAGPSSTHGPATEQQYSEGDASFESEPCSKESDLWWPGPKIAVSNRKHLDCHWKLGLAPVITPEQMVPQAAVKSIWDEYYTYKMSTYNTSAGNVSATTGDYEGYTTMTPVPPTPWQNRTSCTSLTESINTRRAEIPNELATNRLTPSYNDKVPWQTVHGLNGKTTIDIHEWGPGWPRDESGGAGPNCPEIKITIFGVNDPMDGWWDRFTTHVAKPYNQIDIPALNEFMEGIDGVHQTSFVKQSWLSETNDMPRCDSDVTGTSAKWDVVSISQGECQHRPKNIIRYIVKSKVR